ncbi:MAG: iron-containing alcohol dehydrogenase [Nitrososphaerales archaeon]
MLLYSLYRLISSATYFYAPKKIIFELNSSLKLSNELQLLGVGKDSRVLMVIDPAIKSLDQTVKVLKSLNESGFIIDIYSDIEYEPTIECAKRAAEYVRKGDFKAIVGIGGGSTLDVAKIATVAKDNPDKDIEEFIGMDKVTKRPTPLIAIPTTAGTGSEVSRYTVFTKGVGKVGINGVHIIPDIAIVDPVLTFTMPPKVTAGTGLDALSHAIEAMISIDATLLSDALALQSVELVFKYLRRAYYKGSDVEARYFLSVAATTAGIPLNISRVLLGHSMSQTFGPMQKIHHGAGCGMVLPYVMEFYLSAVPEKLAAIAKAAGVDISGLSVWEAAKASIKATWELVKDLDVPLSLKEVGISKADLETLAERTIKEWPRPNSPIELTKERVLKVYEEMYEGKLMRVNI